MKNKNATITIEISGGIDIDKFQSHEQIESLIIKQISDILQNRTVHVSSFEEKYKDAVLGYSLIDSQKEEINGRITSQKIELLC